MRLHHNLEKTSYLFLGCLLNASLSTTAYSAQVRLDSEPTIIDKISLPDPVITTISEDTGVAGDGVTSDNTIKIHGTASANSVVEVTIDGIAVGTAVTDEVGKWLFDHTETELVIGNHTIAATVIDSYGKITNPPTTFNLIIEPIVPEETANHPPIEKPTVNATLNLTVTFGGSGDGSVTSSPAGITCSSKTGDCQYTFEGINDTITLNPVAADNSRFTNWGGHDDCQDGEISVAGGGEKFCMAYFTQNQPLELTLTVEKTGIGQGTITAKGIDCGKDCQEIYPESETLTLTATASEGSQFEGWAGDCVGTGSPITITMDVGKNCLAQFGATGPTGEDNQEVNSPLEEQTDPVIDPIEPETEDNRACPPDRLLNYTCNAHGQTVQNLKIADDNLGLGSLSNAVITGTIYNQGWVSNLLIKETGTVIGGVVLIIKVK